MFPDCILLVSSSQSTNLMDLSWFIGECAFLFRQSLAIWYVMVVGIWTTVTRPVMFTLLLAFSFAIISYMLSEDYVSSFSSSVISVQSNVISLLSGSDSFVLLLMCTLRLDWWNNSIASYVIVTYFHRWWGFQLGLHVGMFIWGKTHSPHWFVF